MEIKLNYSEEELKNLINGLNNAILSIHQVYSAAKFGCEYPIIFSKLFKDKNYEEIEKIVKVREDALLELYNTLLEYKKS